MTKYGLLSPPHSGGGGLLDFDEKQSRVDAFVQGLGAMSGNFLAAGASSTDPGNFGRNMANIGQSFGQTFNGSLNNSRAKAFQDIQVSDMQRKRQREEQETLARDRYINSATMPNGPTNTAGQAQNTPMGLLAKANPKAFVQSSMKNAMTSQSPIEVSPGASLYDPTTRQALWTAPGQNKPTTLQQNLKAAGMRPGTPGYSKAILASLNKPGVAVNLGNDDKTNPKVLARYESAYQNSNDRRDMLRGLETMMRLAPQIDSGYGAGMQLEGSKALAALGIDVDQSKIATAEQFRTLAMDRILERVAMTKGAISEKEMSAFERASPSLANTPQGNQLILKAAIEAERRAAMVDDFSMRTVQESPDIGLFQLDRKVSEFRHDMAKRPVFSPDEMQIIQGAHQASAVKKYNPNSSSAPRVVRNPDTGKLEMQTAPQGYRNPLSGESTGSLNDKVWGN